MQEYFYEMKILCKLGTETKIGRAMGILLIPRCGWGSTKSGVTFLVLVRGKFFLYHLKAYLNGFIFSHEV